MLTIEQLAAVVSEQGGQLDAITVVVGVILEAVGSTSPAGTLIAQRLENWHASNLQRSLNQSHVDGFEKTAEFLTSLLKK